MRRQDEAARGLASGIHPAADPSRGRDPMIEQLKAWAAGTPGLHAAILVGSRAQPRGSVDELSDYDVLLFLDDPEAFAADDAWLGGLGDLLLVLPEGYDLLGSRVQTRLAYYRDGTRIDFTLSSRSALRVIAYLPELPPMLDLGYEVLWDPEGMTGSMCPPQGRGFAGRTPDPEVLLADIREFLWESLVVAKALAREEPHAAAYSGEAVMRHRLLREMLEHRARIEAGWSGQVGPYGRGLGRWLPADLAERSRPGTVSWQGTEGWAALDELLDLHGQAARAVCGDLRIGYPEGLERDVLLRVAEVRRLGG